MTFNWLALAADGPYYLVRIVDAESVFSTNARFLGNAIRQAPVILALELGVTDTQLLSTLLGVGQLVIPALLWSAAILFARGDVVAYSAVAFTAGLCAGASWLCNVGEFVLAMPLVALVGALLWRAQPWTLLHATLAVAASVVLLATYEIVVLMSPALAVWAVWRAVVARDRVDRYGALLVAGASAASILAALVGIASRQHQSHTLSLTYSVVSLDPWPFYLALCACTLVVCAATFRLDQRLRRAVIAAALVALVLSLHGAAPSPQSAFNVRGGTAVATLALVVFLFWRWAAGLKHWKSAAPPRWLAAAPLALIAAMAYVNVDAIERWSRSLDAFQAATNAATGPTPVTEVVPRDRSHVVWGWTSPSLSLVVRHRPTAGVLVDADPSFVPFAPEEARDRIPDAFVWPE
jgi:hypothetical protein